MAINFETFAAVSFTLASALFLYMAVAWVRWVIREFDASRPRRR